MKVVYFLMLAGSMQTAAHTTSPSALPASTGTTLARISPAIPGNVSLHLDGIYRFQTSAELLPKVEYINGQRIVAPEPETMTFNAGEPVAVKFNANGDALIQAVLPDNEVGTVPEAIVVTAAEFDKSLTQMMSNGDLKELADKYSGYEEVQVAGRHFGRRGRAHYRNASGGSYYGCVASVCRSIGGCSGTTGSGRGMTSYLRRKGWHSVSCGSPPVGAVASWSGGRHGKGHTGRWNGSGWCYDLGCGDPGPSYRLRDCVARR